MNLTELKSVVQSIAPYVAFSHDRKSVKTRRDKTYGAMIKTYKGIQKPKNVKIRRVVKIMRVKIRRDRLYTSPNLELFAKCQIVNVLSSIFEDV